VRKGWLEEHPTAQYIAPFVLFLILLGLFDKFPADPRWEAPFRVVLLGVVCFVCWPREIPVKPSYWLLSTVIGAGVFFLWIAPDTLFPGYRNHVLFSNSILGHPHSSIPPAALQSPWVLAWRTARAIVIVPIVEELFWRGWLMRWIINSDFQSVPLGAYTPLAFWLTAVLFASEHGSYWDVGLVTGVIYNLWMIRSKSIADCILMHAVTNAALSAYVIAAGQWQYWQ
jgi:CAAX prenyl protease-like protein